MRGLLAGALVLGVAGPVAAADLQSAPLLPITRLHAGPVTSGDFDHDGILDVAYGLNFPTGVAVLLGDGQGGYLPPIVTQAAGLTQSSAESIAAADLNGDVFPDLVLSDFANGPGIYLGLGDGRFSGRNLGGDILNFDVAVGDFDGDGKRDLAMGHRGLASTAQVLVYRGDGAGEFAVPVSWSLPLLLYPQGLVARDFNGDGRDDIAVADTFGNSVAILLGNAALVPDLRGPFPSGLGPQAVDAGDVDGDGRADVVTADVNSRTVSVFRGDGAGGLGPATSIAAPPACGAVRLADFDADGRLDLAASGSGVWIYRGLGDGAFGPPRRLGVWGALATGRFDGDAHLDLIAGASLVAGDGALGFLAQRNHPTAAAPRQGVAADFNRDGRDDVATIHANGSVSILLADVSGGLLAPTSILTGTDPTDVVAGDVDGDGWPDVVVAHAGTRDVVVLRNDHAGGFVRTTNAVGGRPQSLALGDWDGDGRTDIAVTNEDAGTVQMLRGLGGGAFAPGGTTAVATEPLALAAGRFNADARADLAWSGLSSRVRLLAGTGAGTFVPGPPVDLLAAEHGLVAADVDGDGRTDLVGGADSQLVPFLPSGLGVRRGDGQGGFGPLLHQPLVPLRSLVALDFTRDGRLDVAGFEGHGETFGVALLEGLGDGRFGLLNESPVPVGGTGPHVFAGDFDGDGRQDVGAVLEQGDSVTLLLNRGTSSGTDLSVAVDVDPDPVGPGQPIRFTTTVRNQGPVPARGVRLRFQTPGGIAVSAVTPGLPVCAPGVSLDEQTRYTCEVGALAAGAAFVLTMDASQPAAEATDGSTEGALPGGRLGWADVRATSPDETAPGDNFTTFLSHSGAVDLAVSIADSVDPVVPGQVYRYDVTITNQGAFRATRIFMDARLPPGLASLGLPSGSCFAPEPSVVRCFAGALDPGQAVVRSIDVQAGSFTSARVAVDTTCDEPDIDPANDSDVEETRMLLPVRGEIAHGTVVRATLPPAAPAEDRYLIRVAPYSSYEVALDEASGDYRSGALPVGLDRIGPDTVAVLQAGSAAGAGRARVLRWQNSTSAEETQVVRVRSQGCSTDCGADDTYRLRAYLSSGSFSRFNTTGDQETVVVLQNARATSVTGTLWIWDPAGGLRASHPFVLTSHRVLLLNLASIVPASSGSITVTHDGGYGGLSGKAVAIQPATGFSFDTPLRVAPR